ncbi:MAG: phosphoheptose isomerase [Ignavibacteriae bacterium]|nr:MAG: phosphoheptose isomerase [Ignavibacteriota bacterium]
MKNIIKKEFEEHAEVLTKVIENSGVVIEEVAHKCLRAIKTNNKILLFGNGGSAADAQHIAAELSGRYKKERRGLPALALTTDTSALTAISNDYGFNFMFSRQVEALAKPNDVVIGISTSGNSPNVLEGIKKAKELSCVTIGFSGKNGGKLKEICDINIVIPSDVTARIQEMHILAGHIICQIIEDNL